MLLRGEAAEGCADDTSDSRRVSRYDLLDRSLAAAPLCGRTMEHEEEGDSKPAAMPVAAVEATSKNPSEIPFLIAHWLSGYARKHTAVADATKHLIHAMESDGAFGDLPLQSGSAQYRDVARLWSLPSCHLETLLDSAASASAFVEKNDDAPVNYLAKSSEKLLEVRKGGRSIQEAIQLDRIKNDVDVRKLSTMTMLQKKRFISDNILSKSDGKLTLLSAEDEQAKEAGEAVRKYLATRDMCCKERSQLRGLEKSLHYHGSTMERLGTQRSALIAAKHDPVALLAQLDEIKAAQQNSERTIFQLNRQIPALRASLAQSEQNCAAQRQSVTACFVKTKSLARNYYQPKVSPTNKTLRILENRFSHAATINAHLSYPVYCLKIDKSGQYFITGADDYLVKVFKFWRKERGAILVATLKGHAGVINDISVNADNCFLATASEDGDCRVWGLHDGCQIAILRGHGDGCTMVNWSELIPYQLVTTAADGFARVWDLREACLKRYGRFVRDRPEYTLKTGGKDFHKKSTPEVVQQPAVAQLPPQLPPAPGLPLQDNSQLLPPPPGVPLQLPAPPNGPLQAPQVAQPQNGGEPGAFVINDNLDQDVKLLRKLQHGASVEERSGGPGTRARRAKVKVLCVARCPNGGHFATGDDQGVCRVWQEESDDLLKLDDYCAGRSTAAVANPSPVTARSILTLRGHLAAITDLQYSKKGDRFLTASQSNGLVRIWSWTEDPSEALGADDGSSRSIPHILIKLTRPNGGDSAAATSRQPGARPSRGQGPTISCDVAAWVCDDSKVVTSQSEISKQSTSDIIAGSQYIFLWDSYEGHCLLGIAGAHSRLCPVLLPHPTIPSILCSAGLDGYMKLWNWETGKCFFSHKNIAEHGPLEASERGKAFGYLDGDISDDGTAMVLTDDSGRISVFESSLANRALNKANSPAWMKEQYYSNDYYDLYYDPNGYCVERNSQLPPHLAPKGSRCTHSGTAFSQHVNDSFRNLKGPVPVDVHSARRDRFEVRQSTFQPPAARPALTSNLVRQFDSERTVLFNLSESTKAPSTAQAAPAPSAAAPAASVGNAGQQLSSNWRWRDYNDLGDDDVEHRDSDDEDFEPARRIGGTSENADDIEVEESENEEFDVDLDAEELDRSEHHEPSRQSSRPAQPKYASSDEEEEEDVDEYIEYMSTNNTPSGPFVADYEAHFFKMPSISQADSIKRQWTRRNESNSSYSGRKKYTPQIGDSVVYIPRAHYDTIVAFPSLEAPWQNWSEDAAWPVVRCNVRNVRFRFPFKDYRDTCKSIVAILTLEFSGIPQLSSDRALAWPEPTFVAPVNAHVFEVSLFESDNNDYIVPTDLYVSRLKQLEAAIRDESLEDVAVEAFYAGHGADAEFTAYTGHVQKDSSNDQDLGQPHLSGSGYRSLYIAWSDDQSTEDVDRISPWEVSVAAPAKYVKAPDRPKLTEDEKLRVRTALKAIGDIPEVNDFFRNPVGPQYYDYGTRVEVALCLSFISNRLDADYYGSPYSVVADVRQVYLNCVKYNGDRESVSFLAMEMFSKFEEEALSEENRAYFHKYEAPVGGPKSTLILPPVPQEAETETSPNATTSPVVRRRSPREVNPPRSSLESLPWQADDSPAIGTRRRSTRRLSGEPTHADTRSMRAAARAARMEDVRPMRTLEQLSSRGQVSTRGRSANSTGRRNITSRTMDNGIRRSLRHRVQRNSYSEEPERRSLRPGLRNSQGQAFPNAQQQRRADSLQFIEDTDLDALPTQRTSGLSISAGDLDDQQGADVARQPATADSDSEDGDDEVSVFADDSKPPASTIGRRAASAEQQHYPSEPSDSSDSEDEGPGTENQRRRHSDESFGEPESEPESESDLELPGESSDDSFAFARRRRTAPRRKTPKRQPKRRRRAPKVFVNEEEEDSEEDAPLSRGAERRTRSSLDGGDEGRRATRGSAKPVTRKRSSRPPPADNSRERKRKRRGSPSVSQRSRNTAAPTSYVDPSSSEFTDSSSPSSDEESPRKRGATAAAPNRMKTMTYNQMLKHFRVKKFPDISMRDITHTTNEVLKRLRTMDEGGLFAIPVADAHPAIAESYLALIPRPMDFRTIAEERLLEYRSVAELQEDLMQVFANCMHFNDSASEYHHFAKMMMESLSGVFDAVCEELGVRFRR